MKNGKKLPFVRAILILVTAFLLSDCARPQNDQVTIRFTRWAVISESKNFQYLIDQFEREHPKITVKTEYLPKDAYWKKLNISLQTGDAPDVFMMSSSKTETYFSTHTKFQALDSFDKNNNFGNFSKSIKRPVFKDSSNFGMPVSLAIPTLFYNKRILANAGIPAPSESNAMTWDEFYAILQKLRKTDAKRKVIVYPLRMNVKDLAENLLNAYGTPLFSDTTNQKVSAFNEESATRAFQMLSNIYKNDLQPPLSWGLSAREFGTSDNGLCNGNVAFAYTGMWSIPLMIDA